MKDYAWKIATIDISEDDDLSDAVNILGYEVIGVIVPTGWTAASVTFQIDPGNGTFYLVSGLTLTTPTAAQVTYLNAGVLANPALVVCLTGANIKLVSSGAQGADRKVILMLREL
jgi:hypothetical protein